MLEKLKGQMREALAARAEAQNTLDEIVKAADEAGRSELTEPETIDANEAREAIVAADENIAELRGRIDEFEADEARKADADDLAKRFAASDDAGNGGNATYKVGAEERTYRADLPHQFMTDAYRSQFMGDVEASDRVARARGEAMAEARDVGTGAFGALVVPQYLVDMFAPIARAGRPIANSVQRLPLPASGMTLNVPRGTTGTTTALQSSENAALDETDFDETTLAVSVRTIGGQQDVSRQALERGEMVDQIIFADLAGAYAANVDSHLISHASDGILNTPGINAVTYTDASPTVAEMYPKIADAIQQVNSSRYLPPTVVYMHPRRWGWFTAAVDSSNRPLVVPSAPQNPVGVGEAAEYGQVVGTLMGLPVITDANIPTDLGSGTDEDRVIVARASDILLWENGDGAPRELRFEQTAGGNLTVKMVAYNYIAATAGRYPKAVSVISGTGLVAPTF